MGELLLAPAMRLVVLLAAAGAVDADMSAHPVTVNELMPGDAQCVATTAPGFEEKFFCGTKAGYVVELDTNCCALRGGNCPQ